MSGVASVGGGFSFGTLWQEATRAVGYIVDGLVQGTLIASNERTGRCIYLEGATTKCKIGIREHSPYYFDSGYNTCVAWLRNLQKSKKIKKCLELILKINLQEGLTKI